MIKLSRLIPLTALIVKWTRMANAIEIRATMIIYLETSFVSIVYKYSSVSYNQ